MLTDSSDLSVKSAEGKAGQRGQCVNSLFGAESASWEGAEGGAEKGHNRGGR